MTKIISKKVDIAPKKSPPAKVKSVDLVTSVDTSSTPETKTLAISPKSVPKLKPNMKDLPMWARSVAPESFPDILTDLKEVEDLNTSTVSTSRPESKWAQRVHNNENFTIFSQPSNDDAILLSMSVSDGDFLNTMVSNPIESTFPSSNSVAITKPPSISPIQDTLVVATPEQNIKLNPIETNENNKDESSKPELVLGEVVIKEIETVIKFENDLKSVDKVSGISLVDEDDSEKIPYSAFDNSSIESFNKLQNDPFIDSVHSDIAKLQTPEYSIEEDICLKTITNFESSVNESIKLFAALSNSEKLNSVQQSAKDKLLAIVEKLNSALSLPNKANDTNISSKNIEDISTMTSTLVVDKIEAQLMSKLEKLIADSIASALTSK